MQFLKNTLLTIQWREVVYTRVLSTLVLAVLGLVGFIYLFTAEQVNWMGYLFVPLYLFAFLLIYVASYADFESEILTAHSRSKKPDFVSFVVISALGIFILFIAFFVFLGEGVKRNTSVIPFMDNIVYEQRLSVLPTIVHARKQDVKNAFETVSESKALLADLKSGVSTLATQQLAIKHLITKMALEMKEEDLKLLLQTQPVVGVETLSILLDKDIQDYVMQINAYRTETDVIASQPSYQEVLAFDDLQLAPGAYLQRALADMAPTPRPELFTLTFLVISWGKFLIFLFLGLFYLKSLEIKLRKRYNLLVPLSV